jgi:diguanylate cyclase (GGDEF)-like protein
MKELKRLADIITDRESRPSIIILTAAVLVLLSAVTAADIMVGRRTSLELFYPVPVFMAAWLLPRRLVISASVIACLSVAVAGYFISRPFSIFSIWNMVSRTVLLAVFSYLAVALKESCVRVEMLRGIDRLTGAVSAPRFSEILAAEIFRSLRYNHPFSVALIDIKGFKAFNGALGREAGDSLLKEVAGKSVATVRRTDIVARTGPGEFAVLFTETGSEGAQKIAERLRRVLMSIKVEGADPLSYGMGVVTYIDRECSFEDVLKTALDLMRESKNDDRCSIRYGILSRS